MTPVAEKEGTTLSKSVITLYGTFSLADLGVKKELELPLPFFEQFNGDEIALFEARMCCQTVSRCPTVTYCGDTSDPSSRFGFCITHIIEH